MNNPTSDHLQFWKAKYAALVNELMEYREKADTREKLLCRTIIRLTLATSGLDPVIDPHLVHIRDLLRKGISNEQRLRELDTVSETLLREVKNKNGNDKFLKRESEGLFRLVKQLAADDQERKAIALLEQGVDQGQITDWKRLFSELQAALRRNTAVSMAAEAPKPGFWGRLLQIKKMPVGETVELGAIRDQLLMLLDAIELPLNFSHQAEHIKNRLKSETDAQALQTLLNDAIVFLGDVKSFIQKEQLEIEHFFADLSGRLSELEQDATGVSVSTRDFVRSREAEHSSFSEHLENFRSEMDAIAELDQLKTWISGGLENLLDRLQSDRDRELSQLRDSSGKLGELTQRLKELELEAADLRSKLRLAHDLALRDPLTGLPNRKAYQDRISQEIARLSCFHQPFSLLLWDVDHFKGINDRFGHSAGDKVLVTVAQELEGCLRKTDFVARLGGEEFAMVLCGADGNTGRRIADQIRQKIGHCGFNSQGRPVRVTVSCGVSQAAYGDTPESLFERADKALYKAKKAGRDRCVLI